METEQWLILGLAALSMITVLVKYLKSRRQAMPPSARNDVKARRLWRGDPQAYERKFGDIDRQLEASEQQRKSD